MLKASICILAKCKSLKKPKNGELEISTDGFISRGQFNCSIGYTLNGSESGVCSENGTWDISTPNCGTQSFLYL